MGDVFLILACTLTILGPLHWLVWREMRLLDDPRQIRALGVVIVRDEVLDCYGDVIGYYAGVPIHGSVVFKNMRYEYDCIVSARYRARIGANELYLDPGLLYRTRG